MTDTNLERKPVFGIKAASWIVLSHLNRYKRCYLLISWLITIFYLWFPVNSGKSSFRRRTACGVPDTVTSAKSLRIFDLSSMNSLFKVAIFDDKKGRTAISIKSFVVDLKQSGNCHNSRNWFNISTFFHWSLPDLFFQFFDLLFHIWQSLTS